jgi:sterol 14-demethylase
MAMTHSNFYSSAGKRYGNATHVSLSHSLRQYGDVFTFILLGRKVTVALGAKGNNFVLGGKSTAFSAADAYTV